MDICKQSCTIEVKKSSRQRYDSIGTPESPFRIMLLNIAKKTDLIQRGGQVQSANERRA